ncbi:MAG: type IIA DNA topoisomerase subunit B [Proteobacteria bacterium]|nr:type IIA DNA topoisomerase subunit B [Pseudomonadota bacterium]
MYIAGTDTPAGLHQLVFEILDNSVDEAMNGHADEIKVILHADGCSVTVSDNGRGIPVDNHPIHKKPALELILTTLHAGGKFSNKNYQTAGGLHGVGSSVVNALSEKLVATIRRDGKEFQQSYSRGKPTSALKVINKSAKGSGTSMYFRPDTEIFRVVKFSSDYLRETMKSRAYLNPGLKIIFSNEVKNETEEFFYPDGIKAFLKQIIEEKKYATVADEVFYIEKFDEIDVKVAFIWSDATKEDFYTYANGIFTPDGGSHEQGAKSGIVKAVRNYIDVHKIQMKGVKLGAEDIREGLVCIVSVKLPSAKYQAQFQGQTKSKLNNPEVAPLVENITRSLEQLLNEKPSVAQAIVNRIILASKARAASRAAGQEVRRKIGVSHRLTLPGKLSDCSSSRSDETELFIVEGDSAGGSAKQGRDRNTQAILPLRGKVLNTIVSNSKKVAENKELSNIIAALGCGVGVSCVPDKLRYSKIIILTDADADGMHIATLLLAFFFQHMRPLIEAGAIYLGKPPLFGIFPQERGKKKEAAEDAKGKKKGKKDNSFASAFWAYSDDELNQIISEKKLNSPRIVRYKGLGEMNPETLWGTTLDPEYRTILRVSLDDEAAVESCFNDLMGTETAARYRMICEQADRIELDI